MRFDVGVKVTHMYNFAVEAENSMSAMAQAMMLLGNSSDPLRTEMFVEVELGMGGGQDGTNQ